MTTQLDTLIAAALERRVIREGEERERKARELDEHHAQLVANFREWYTGAFLDELRMVLESAGARIVVPRGKDVAILTWPEGPGGQGGHWILEFVARAGVAGSEWQLTTPTYDYVRIGAERESNLDDALLCAMADWRAQQYQEHQKHSATPTEWSGAEVLEEAPF